MWPATWSASGPSTTCSPCAAGPNHAARAESLQRALVDQLDVGEHETQARRASCHLDEISSSAERGNERVGALRRRPAPPARSPMPHRLLARASPDSGARCTTRNTA